MQPIHFWWRNYSPVSQTIVQELHGTTLEGFWASISFLLAVVIVQPIYTSVSNVMGRLMPLYLSFLLFMVGSVVFAVARNMGVLIAGRLLQGLGAGGLDVLNEIILADITTLKERPMYLGYFSIPLLGGTVLGPIIGSAFTQFVTWRWIGWFNLPLSALGLGLALIFLRLKAIDQGLGEKLRRLDWGGFILFTAGCTLFTTPMVWAGAMFPWSAYQTLVPFLLGAVLLAAFGWYESRPLEPVFPYRVFQTQTACVTLAAGVLHGVANYIIPLYGPMFFQVVYLQEPLPAAVSTLPTSIFAIASAVAAAILVEATRKYRLLILGSWVVLAVGAGLLTLLGRTSTLAVKESFQVVLGLGLGPFWSVLNLPMQCSIRNVDDMGLVAGILVSFRLFGGLIGLSVASTIFNSAFAAKIHALAPLPEQLAVLNDVREAVGFIPFLRQVEAPPDVLNQVIDVYKTSMYRVFWLVAGASGLGLLTSYFIKEESLEREELGRQHFEDKDGSA